MAPLLKEALDQKVITNHVADQFTCTVCKCGVSGAGNIISHLKGANHKKAFQRTQLGIGGHTVPVTENKSPPNSLNTSLSSEVSPESASAGSAAPLSGGVLRCDVCGVCCAGEVPMAAHLQGKAHARALLRNKLAENLKEYVSPMETENSGAPLQKAVSKEETSAPADAFRAAVASAVMSVAADGVTVTCHVCSLRCSGEVSALQHLEGRAHLKAVAVHKNRGALDPPQAGNGCSLDIKKDTVSIATGPGSGVGKNIPEEVSNTVPSNGVGKIFPVELGNTIPDGFVRKSNPVEVGKSLPTTLDADAATQRVRSAITEATLEVVLVNGLQHYSCKVCKSGHMNSVEMAVSHLSGAAHLKSLRKRALSGDCVS